MENEMDDTCSTHELNEKCIKILIGKPERKNRPLGRTKRKREDNIRMDLRETGWEGVDWMHLA
jgi:hypothetical protein